MSKRTLTFKEQRRLEMEIDLRLVDVWAALADNHELLSDENREMLATALRLAYGQGYHDCLDETDRAEGDLHTRVLG